MQTFRHISETQVVDAALPLTEVRQLVLEGFRLHGLGEYENPPKQCVHPRTGALLHAMPAYIPSLDIAGTKLVTVYPDNPERGLPATTGIVAMIDPDTGLTTDIVDAAWLTNARTAVVSTVTAEYLAPPDPVFGVMGATGSSGRAHLDAIATFFPGSRVLVNSRSRQRCEALMDEYSDHDLELTFVAEHETIVRRSDVLALCLTLQDRPVLDPAWLHAGQLVLNVQPRAWPAAVIRAVDRVVCDDRAQVMDLHNGLLRHYPDLDPDIEMGEVVTGRHPGREDETQVILSLNYGLAIFDILVADAIRDRV